MQLHSRIVFLNYHGCTKKFLAKQLLVWRPQKAYFSKKAKFIYLLSIGGFTPGIGAVCP